MVVVVGLGTMSAFQRKNALTVAAQSHMWQQFFAVVTSGSVGDCVAARLCGQH
jgi:hypothetical protein